MYDGSLIKALTAIYPEKKFTAWDFHAPQGFWSKPINQKTFLQEFQTTMNLKSMEDWQSVRAKDIVKHGGSGLMKRYNGSIRKLLSTLHPQADLRLVIVFMCTNILAMVSPENQP
jgi:hypothetical protein